MPGRTSESRSPVCLEPAARPRSRIRRPMVSAVPLDRLDVLDVDDGARARRELADLGWAGGGLPRPGMVVLAADGRPGLAQPRDAGAREPRDALRMRSLPEREHVEPVGPGLERVGALERQMDEAVACAHLVADRVLALALPPLDGDARAAEHVEDLLLCALEVERRGPLPRVDLDALDARLLRGTTGQAPPGAGDVAALPAPGSRLVPVRDHTAIMSRDDRRGRPLDRGMKRRPQLVDRSLSGITSFLPRPRLGIDEERPQLHEDLTRAGADPIERLDPLEPGEHCVGVLHAATVERQRSHASHDFEPGP